MSAAGRTVFIAGAGIAGLSLALALAKFGASVVVLERQDAVSEFGAGLQVSPNARRVLNSLGLDRQITASSFEPEGIDVYGAGGTAPIVTMALGSTARDRYGVPYAVMHRADLADALYRACRRFASIDIVFGVERFTAAATDRGLSIVADGAGGRRSGRAYAFVGADGVHSATRTGLLGGSPAEATGLVAWRAMLDPRAVDDVIALDRTSLLLAPGYHAVCYPLPQRGAVNVALFSRQPGGEHGHDRPALPQSAGKDRRLSAILSAAGDSWTPWPLSTVDAPRWHDGAIGLIGDAAHAMLPFQAQGAAMAMEDAATLAPLLMTEPTAEAAFRRYAALRRQRVARVARLSAANAGIFHLGWPASAARNAVMRLQGRTGHLSRLDWLYGFDTAPEAEKQANRG